MKPWTEARNNKYMKYHSKFTYQLSFWNVSRKVDYHAGGKWFIHGPKRRKALWYSFKHLLVRSPDSISSWNDYFHCDECNYNAVILKSAITSQIVRHLQPVQASNNKESKAIITDPLLSMDSPYKPFIGHDVFLPQNARAGFHINTQYTPEIHFSKVIFIMW